MNLEALKKLETGLWEAATTLRNSSGLKSNEYSTPILGIVFLRFAEKIYAAHFAEITQAVETQQGKRNQMPIEKIAIAKCGFYLPETARYDYLKNGVFKADGKNAREALQDAMRLMEQFNDLNDTLPIQEYDKLSAENIEDLLKQFAQIPLDADTDVFGKIYEFFLGEFAMGEGQKGGEFYTPAPVVKLMVEILEPKGGKLLDPACGSGGMFVQSANYMRRKNYNLNQLVVYGFEKSSETSRLARMNTKINQVRSFITAVNTFETSEAFVGQYDYVLANPPFNVKEVKARTVEHKVHFNAYGLPKNKGKSASEETIPNANYLWINLFATALKPQGKAALVMANSASDASGAEAEVRQRLIENEVISAMLTLSSNLFNTVTLPATLWFFENREPALTSLKKQGTILFVDARNIFTQLTRKQRTLTHAQIQNIALIFQLHRGENHRFSELIDQYQQEIQVFGADIAQKEADLKEKPNWGRENLSKTLLKEVTVLEQEIGQLCKQRDALQENIGWLQARFPEGVYRDVTGLCKAASWAEIAEQNYSLNPGRYVGVVIEQDGLTAEAFQSEIQQYHAELARLNAEAQVLEAQIQENGRRLLG